MRNLSLGTILGIIFGILFVGYAVFAFNPPTQAPPAGNAPTPLNVGPQTQTKQGGLNVLGEVRSNTLCIGGACKTAWPGLGFAKNILSYYAGGVNFSNRNYTTLASVSTSSETPNIVCSIAVRNVTFSGMFCGRTRLEFVCNNNVLWAWEESGDGISKIQALAPASCVLRGKTTCPLGYSTDNGSYPRVAIAAACAEVTATAVR